MEKIIELGGEIDLEKEVTTLTSATFDSSINPKFDNQLSNLASTSQQKCLPVEQSTTECDGQLEDYSQTDKVHSSRIFFKFKLTMLLQYGKELLGFLALLLTTYATMLNKEPIIGETLSPRPIFAKDSIVQEWPYGHLIDVQAKVAVSELSLIFFYAPWCAESLFAKKVYNSVANLYSREAYFAAVNCWQPNSGCRTSYSNVYKWPVLMAYLPNGLSVQYNGPWNYNSLTTFIERLMMPIVRVYDVHNLMQLRIANDAVVLGVFKSVNCKEYQIFFQTAISLLGSNSFENIKFAVYVGEKTLLFLPTNDIQTPVINVFTTNETMVYNNTKWISKQLIVFLKKHLEKSNIWINLSSTKSSAMHERLQRGPLVLMFAPRESSSYHYFIMKQLMAVHKNNQDGLSSSVLNQYVHHMQKDLPKKLKKLTQFCEFAKKIRYLDIETALYDVGVWEGRLYSLGVKSVNTSSNITPNVMGNDCSYTNCDGKLLMQYVHQKYGSKFSFDVLDHQSPLEILRTNLEKKCIHLERIPLTLLQKNLIESISLSMLLEPTYEQNRTLTFLMLDSILYHDYLRNLIGEFGIKQHSSLSPALIIIDNESESLYMHKGAISTSSAMEFLKDFNKGKLRRHLRSSRISENLHSSINTYISIKEINSEKFSKLIHWTNVTSVVLFYSPQCSLCSVMSQTLLHVANIIKLKNVQFYRMDGSTNDVCWEYTMDKYPTLIVFPENRTTDTTVFPSSLKINVKNVFGFILSTLKPEQQLKSLINACILTKVSGAFQNAVRHVRLVIDSEINRLLLQWHRTPSRRPCILERLSILKKIYLEVMRARKGSDLETILRYFDI